MVDFSAVPLWVIFVLSLVLIFGAVELGRWIGAVRATQHGDTVNVLVAATLGLVALMMSFTFSVALSRFEARVDAVLNEASAIGTTALRARLLPEPQAGASLDLLRQYAQLRLDVTLTNSTPAELAAAIDRSNAIQESLWRIVETVAAKDNAMVPTGIYVQSLNEMIDSQGKRLAALRNRVPGIVIVALYGIAALALGITGYSGWTEAQRSRIAGYFVGFAVASVILLIQDLDRPNAGFINVSQQPMIDTVRSLAGYGR